MPNFNDAESMPRSVNALLQQEVADMELIIIDDGSTDNSWQVIRELQTLDSRIFAVKNEMNIGTINTALRGLEIAHGELIYFASANDCLQRGFFHEALQELDKHPSAGFFCGNAQFYDIASKQESFPKMAWGEVARYISPDDLRDFPRKNINCFFGQSVLLCKKHLPPKQFLFEKLGGNFDLFIFSAMAFRHGFCYSPRICSLITISSNAVSAREKTVKEKSQKIVVFLENLDLPYYDDVRPKVIQSGILSFLGFALPYLIIKNFYWRYCSWRLIRDYIKLLKRKLQERKRS